MRTLGFLITWHANLALCSIVSAATPLPHIEEVAAGVYVAGFADVHQSANSGWIVLKTHTLLVDLPRGVKPSEYLSHVRSTHAPPPTSLIVTRYQEGDGDLLKKFLAAGVERVFCSRAVHTLVIKGTSDLPPERVLVMTANTSIGDASNAVEVIPLDGVVPDGGAAIYLADRKTLFAGPFVSHGPRIVLPETSTSAWIDALRRFEKLSIQQVIPGYGSWGDKRVLSRHRRFLVELRRQIGYLIAQGRPRNHLVEVSIPADYLVWMPYDNPRIEDLEHVYSELCVPIAPYGGQPPKRSDAQPHALVLIGDRPHEPGHIEEGLRPVFESTGVTPHFTVDVEALNADNLRHVPLLVILRDGLQRPKTGPKSDYIWMTPEQERAVVEFVEGGGAFLNLHNSMGLYPDNGPYLNIVGGRYIGHGPLERFRVEVVDPNHPITRGVSDYSISDEQHTPPFDEDRCHLLLRSRSDDGKAVAAAGWVRKPKQGRLCHLANGHTRESLLHPMYQRLMRNAVNWLLRRE